MASVHKESVNGTVSYRVVWHDKDGRRRRLRLSNRKDADYVAPRIQAVVNAQISGRPLDASTVLWIESLGDSLHAKLSKVGLLEPRSLHGSEADRKSSTSFVELIDLFVASRADAADNTVRNWKNTREKLSSFFGNRTLDEITRGDCDDWNAAMTGSGKLSDATISKAIKHARQFGAYVMRKGWAERNPFDHLRAKGERNESRKHFVDRKTIDRIVEACPTTEWKAIVVLCRYGGLRCPSELLALRWSDVSLDGNRITVTSPKTKRYQKGERVIPLFAELRPILEDLRELSPDAEFVVTQYRDATSNLRTQFQRILKRAGVPSWPKLFHNLRASRQTELENEFPSHVVCQWMGNSVSVARDHYLQVTEEHFERAVTSGADLGLKSAEAMGIDGNPRPKSAPAIAVFPENCGFPAVSDSLQIPPRGVEPLLPD